MCQPVGRDGCVTQVALCMVVWGCVKLFSTVHGIRGAAHTGSTVHVCVREGKGRGEIGK